MRRVSGRKQQPKAMHRWLRFNFVGLIGVGVQLSVLQILISGKLDYRVATLVAVEMAVLNNFFWHLRFTWRERQLRSSWLVIRRLMEFHLTNGLVSLAGSWTLIALLVGRARVPVIVANIMSIAACSMVNFMLAEVLVFRTPQRSRVS
jgi:putative flippase GtrA